MRSPRKRVEWEDSETPHKSVTGNTCQKSKEFMLAETLEGQEEETPNSPPSAETSDFDDKVNPSDLVEPDNALPASDLT